jgi:polyisoprenoid-binding protein YceI
MSLKSEPKASNASVEYTSSGELTICGVKKTIEMPVAIERLGQGKLKITGMLPLKMTNFGIEPPSPKISFGRIKTDDNVRITLEWVIAKSSQVANK